MPVDNVDIGFVEGNTEDIGVVLFFLFPMKFYLEFGFGSLGKFRFVISLFDSGRVDRLGLIVDLLNDLPYFEFLVSSTGQHLRDEGVDIGH